MKEDFQISVINTQLMTPIYDCSNDDDFFQVLESKVNSNSFISEEENEVSRYMKLPQIGVNQDPLKWCDVNK
ncbi:10690_t:CDS:1, partial [Racocetra fulgida]